MDFTIDEQYLTSITIREEWNTYTSDGRVPTAEELLLILKGKGHCSMTSSSDHPEFAKLRDQLEAEGYIKTCRNSWNGDRVIHPFRLNGKKFEVDEQFSCASAIRYKLTR